MPKANPRARRRRGGYAGRAGGPGPGVWLSVAVGAAILVLVVLKLVTPSSTGTGPRQDNTPVAASIVQQLATVPAAAFNAIGVHNAPLAYGGSAQVWRGTQGQPVMFYLGGEYCPYCAASRWSMVVALARFGQWSGLEYMTSSTTDVDPGTRTLTFVHAKLQSPYVQFQSVEGWNNTGPAANYTLQTPNQQQSAVINKYTNPPFIPASSAGGIPFIDVGNRYIWDGTLYDPALLQGLSWAQIAQQVHSGKGAVAQAVLGPANAISAAVCALDGQRPTAVCDSPAVRAGAAGLPAANNGKQAVGGGTG